MYNIGINNMIEIKQLYVQIALQFIILWFILNVAVFIFNIFVFWGDDDTLKKTPLVATALWIGCVLVALCKLFVIIIP